MFHTVPTHDLSHPRRSRTAAKSKKTQPKGFNIDLCTSFYMKTRVNNCHGVIVPWKSVLLCSGHNLDIWDTKYISTVTGNAQVYKIKAVCVSSWTPVFIFYILTAAEAATMGHHLVMKRNVKNITKSFSQEKTCFHSTLNWLWQWIDLQTVFTGGEGVLIGVCDVLNEITFQYYLFGKEHPLFKCCLLVVTQMNI